MSVESEGGVSYNRIAQEVENGNVTGIMNILGKTTEFSGLLKDKQMMISGELDIGIRKIVYTGYGMIEEGSLQMQIKDKERTYDLTGHKEGL